MSDKKYQWHLNVTLIPILELLYLIDNVVHLGEIRDFEVYSKTLAQRKDLFQYNNQKSLAVDLKCVRKVIIIVL